MILFVPVLVSRWWKPWRCRLDTQRPSCPSSPSWASSRTTKLWCPPTTPHRESGPSAPAVCYRMLLIWSWFCSTAEDRTSDCSLWSTSSRSSSQVWLTSRSPCRSMRTSKDSMRSCLTGVTMRLCVSFSSQLNLKEQRFYWLKCFSLNNGVKSVLQMTAYYFHCF